ncbi:type II secretion system F family protein [Streptacidiphilus sp. P02-A3a]|uniref:type II secretion system F family protein n=1 Tax=Streptacidiphilus sp. P02-A3a TaxID=2704468 RepID=UPI0015FDA257|nr:type II secretion system F family protein [Streptacidiphilus sp. P02-A3a]QMU67224.1 type II secretion system F family protein [Streptacidiphilus sp. P02-A3a]
MDAAWWTAVLVSGAAAALLGGLRALAGHRVRARARTAGMPLARARAQARTPGRHRVPDPAQLPDRAPGRHRGRPGGLRHRRRAPSPGRPTLSPAVLRGGAALLIGAGVAVSLDGAFGLVVGIVAAAISFRWLPDPPTAELRRAAAEAAALRAQLPLTADLLAGCLVSWCAPATAAEAVAGAIGEPMAARLAEVAADLRMGADAEESWARFGADPVLAPLGRCLLRACASGAPPAAGLARLAEGCRAEAATAAQGRARRAGVLATAPLGLCFLPAFVLIGVVPVVTGLAGSFLVHS